MNAGVQGSNGQSQAADPHVQEVIRSAERELHELLQQRADLMKRIGTIKQTLAGLANIFGDSVLSDELLTYLDRKTASRQPGFTRACRVVLMESGKPLGARFVCQALQQKFPELLERHKDPIASVTTVLNRLADYTEARCSLDANGRRVWEWIVDRESPAALLLGSDPRLASHHLASKTIVESTEDGVVSVCGSLLQYLGLSRCVKSGRLLRDGGSLPHPPGLSWRSADRSDFRRLFPAG